MCSCMGSVSVSSCRYGMFVSCVHHVVLVSGDYTKVDNVSASV